MVKTLNLRFEDKEYRLLRKAYDAAVQTSWEKFFVSLAEEILESMEYE